MKFRRRHNTIEDLRRLRRALEHVSLKIATGATLEAALRGQRQTLYVAKPLARQWQWMHEAIAAGRVPPKHGVEAFVELVETHTLCLSETRKRGLNAKIQSRVLLLMSVILMVGISALMDTPLVSISNGIAFGLCAFGFAILLIIEKRLTRVLWRLEWLMLWFYVRTLIECGMTPTQSLNQSLVWCPLSSKVPLGLRNQLYQMATTLRRGETFAAASSQTTSVEAMDEDIIYQFAQAVHDGVRTAVITQSYGKQYQKWLQESLAEAAERSAYLNLLPLYLCFAPAMFLAILGPVVIAYLSSNQV